MKSQNYARLSTNALNLIADLHEAEKNYDKVVEEAAELGVKHDDKDETMLAFLGRVAAAAVEKKHDEEKKEALEWVANSLNNEPSTNRRPRSLIGRTLGRLSQAIG